MSTTPAARWCAATGVAATLAFAGCGGDDGGGSSEPAKAPTQATQTQTTPAPAVARLKLARLERNLPAFLNSGRIKIGTPGGGSTPSRAEVTKASCPDSVEKKTGATFRCTVSGPQGVHGYIVITFTDPNGKSFKYKANISGGPFGKFSGSVG